jgi:hypothetical protein
LRVTFPHATILTPVQQRAEAGAIRDYLRRRTLDSVNLTDPYPYDSHFEGNTYGQHVVDETLSLHKDLLVLGLHASPTENSASVILASNFGRIGKPDDAGDLKIVATEQTQSLVTKAGNRCNFGLPLHDILGHTIGLITVAYAYADGDNQTALLARAVGVRDEVSRHLLNRDSLLEKYPLDPQLLGDTYAQAIVDDVLLKHPRVVGVALHVTPPGRADNLILASTFGRVGAVIGRVGPSDDPFGKAQYARTAQRGKILRRTYSARFGSQDHRCITDHLPVQTWGRYKCNADRS